MTVELRQLSYFDAVARHGHFTRAAEQLRVAQPAISAQIRRLESELGTELFHRTTRRVELTHAGELFWVRVRRVIDELQAARGELADLTEVLRGSVRLGAIQSLGPFDLPACLAGFHSLYPGVTLHLHTAHADAMYAAVRRGETDLALCPAPSESTGLQVQPVFTDELVVALPPGHPQAQQPGIRLAQLRDEAFVSMPADTALYSALAEAAEADGFTPHVQFETRDPQHIRALVSHGLGVALIPRSIAEAQGAPLSITAVAPQPLARTTALVNRRDRKLSPAASALRTYLIDWSRRTSG